MQNQNLTSPSTTTTETETAPVTRRRLRDLRVGRRRIVAAGAVAAIGLLVGTGFTIRSVAENQARVEATAAVTEATGLHHDQLAAYTTIAQARAEHTAKDTIAAAEATLAAAQGKVDAASLQASVASLGDYEKLPLDSLVDLTKQTKTKTAETAAAAAEYDRVQQQKAQEAAEALARANTPEGAKAIAADLAASQYGWGGDQFQCLVNLWQKESGWNYAAYNASSGATGIPQSLPGSKMATAGADWQTNAATQIRWGLDYIKRAYGTPCGAWGHSQAMNWY